MQTQLAVRPSAAPPAVSSGGSYGAGAMSRSAYEAEVIALREQLEEAQATIDYLKDLISPPGLLFPPRWKLTDKEARCLRALMAAVSLTKEQLLVALYDTEPDVEIKIVDVFVCKLRTKIARDRLPIETMWGSGYRISPPVKDLINDAADHARRGLEWVPPTGPARRPLLGLQTEPGAYTGAELREQRHALGLSQLAVGQLAGLPHMGYVSSVENGGGAAKFHHLVEKALKDERRKRCIPDPTPRGMP